MLRAAQSSLSSIQARCLSCTAIEYYSPLELDTLTVAVIKKKLICCRAGGWECRIFFPQLLNGNAERRGAYTFHPVEDFISLIIKLSTLHKLKTFILKKDPNQRKRARRFQRENNPDSNSRRIHARKREYHLKQPVIKYNSSQSG